MATERTGWRSSRNAEGVAVPGLMIIYRPNQATIVSEAGNNAAACWWAGICVFAQTRRCPGVRHLEAPLARSGLAPFFTCKTCQTTTADLGRYTCFSSPNVQSVASATSDCEATSRHRRPSFLCYMCPHALRARPSWDATDIPSSPLARSTASSRRYRTPTLRASCRGVALTSCLVARFDGRGWWHRM